MASIKTKWWGVKVKLNKGETCAVTSGSLAATGIAAFLGIAAHPVGWAIAVAIFAHKMWIHTKVGTRGVILHITWAGFLKKVKRRGSPSSCPPIY